MNDEVDVVDEVRRGPLRYEGKAKRVYAVAGDDSAAWVTFKDDATAFNAAKRGTIPGKGVLNEAITAHLMERVAAGGVPTHHRRTLAPGVQLVDAVRIVPVEVIVRNRAAGSFASRYGVHEGRPLSPTVIEWCLKSDELQDPPMNRATAVALGFAREDQLEAMFRHASTVNEVVAARFREVDLELIDFKLEFGERPDGTLVLADEISPDTCRLWDVRSGDRLDKDRFRRDLGGVVEAYREVHRRLLGKGDP